VYTTRVDTTIHAEFCGWWANGSVQTWVAPAHNVCYLAVGQGHLYVNIFYHPDRPAQ